jgi:hypothetical protein
MNSLVLLKERLQTVLNGSTESESFKDAISEGLYACDLSVIGLEQWIAHWIEWKSEDVVNRNDDHDYLEGVKFVEEQWHKITGMF